MNERNLTVIGSYDTREEALAVIEQLRDEGYSRDDIKVYTSQEASDRLGFGGLYGIDVETTTDTGHTQDKEDVSLWDRIKGAFSFDTYDYDENEEEIASDTDPLYAYRGDITGGKAVIAVNNYHSANPGFSAAETTTGPDSGMTTDDFPAAEGYQDTADDQTIQLKEEHLDVNTHDVTTGQVEIHKEVVNDTETIEVPVKREEVVIERKPISKDGTPVDDTTLEDDTITIPIKEEQIDVSKHTVVREEVGIHKETHEDVKKVTEDVQREELDVDTSGDVHVADADNPDKRSPKL